MRRCRILKNSWNTVWSDQGYMKLGKGTGSKKGICGVNMQPVYATATKGPPPAPGPPVTIRYRACFWLMQQRRRL